MLSGQRRAVAELAAAAENARERAARAAARTERAKSRFLANPLNLLLPFTGGVLGGALALHRRPVSERKGHEERHHRPVAWASLATTATTLWNASLPLRLSLAESRAAARLHDEAVASRTSAEPADGSSEEREPSGPVGSSGPSATSDSPGTGDERTAPTDRRAPLDSGQPAPPA